MNKEFPRIITLLRKEKGISQKQVSTELHISQALLSHYEKGIRECGLDFVVKVADYYNVSCDYLLGRSLDRSGSIISTDEVPNKKEEVSEKKLDINGSVFTVLNKKLINNSLSILFDILDKTNNKFFINEISKFLMLSIYRMFRILYSINKNNNQKLFNIPKSFANTKALSKMIIYEMNVSSIVDNNSGIEFHFKDNPDKLILNSEKLIKDYPMFYSSLFNLIKICESELTEQNDYTS